MEENIIDAGSVNMRNDVLPISKGKSFEPNDGARGLFAFLIFETALVLTYYVFALSGFLSGWLYSMLNQILEVGFILTVLYACKRSHKDFLSCISIKKKFSGWYILLSFAVAIICLFGLSHLTDLFLEFMYSIGYKSVATEIDIVGFGSYIYNIIFVAVLPAICEEIMFRGLIYQSLNKVNRWLAIFGSAFLFMLIHGSPDQTVHQFILGVILAFCFEATGNILVPMLIHFFNNFITLTYTYIMYSVSSGASDALENASAGINIYTYIIYAVVFAAVSIVLIALIVKALRKISGKENNVNITARDLETNENINVEIIDKDNSVISSVDIDDFSTINEPQKTRLTKVGVIYYVISIIWMAYEWIRTCISGFGG